MFSLVFSAGCIYTLPYLRQSYHSTMLEALGVTNAELGWLNSAFGVFALVCYLPGGWVADRFGPKLLLTVSMIATGLGGFAFAAFPPYPVLLAIHALWGVTTILTFWAALIKATRAWGTRREQGKAFGLLDGGRGVVEGVAGIVTIAVFSSFATKTEGLGGVIITYSIACLLGGVVVWLFVPEVDDGSTTAVDLSGFAEAARLPVVWCQALVIMFAYSAYWATFDLAAFAVDGFEQSEVFGASLATFRTWLRPIAAIAAGLLADKIRPSKAVTAGFLMLVVAYGALAAMPTSASMLWLLWIDVAVISIAVFALRGVYFALLEEGGVPLRLTGSVVGLVSILGYTPDIIMPILSGWLLDTFPGATGHRYLFGIVAIGSILGVVATRALAFFATARSTNVVGREVPGGA